MDMVMKPILFNTEMVCANLDGRKSATRRLIKPQPEGKVCHYTGYKTDYWGVEKETSEGSSVVKMKMPYMPGDILYVRETWCLRYDGEKYFYLADKNTDREESLLLDYDDVKWRPSIHMPKEAARLFLKVTSVSAQRLQDILSCQSEIVKEGIVFEDYVTAEKRLTALWNSTVKPGDRSQYGWEANPWVWAIEYERYYPSEK